jgi:hypothetical protein
MANMGEGGKQTVHGLKHEADHLEDLDVQENTIFMFLVPCISV